MDAVDVSSGHQWVEVREEEERAAREAVKWEQDQAYKESLEADRYYIPTNDKNEFFFIISNFLTEQKKKQNANKYS